MPAIRVMAAIEVALIRESEVGGQAPDPAASPQRLACMVNAQLKKPFLCGIPTCA
jgi:hypothetical protein